MFASSWVGATVFWIGEWFIKRMPFVKHIYSASKQISTAISPGNTVIFGLKIHYYPEFNILLEFRIYTQYIIRVITAIGSMTYTSQITIMIEIVNFTFSRLHSEFRFLVIFQFFVISPLATFLNKDLQPREFRRGSAVVISPTKYTNTTVYTTLSTTTFSLSTTYRTPTTPTTTSTFPFLSTPFTLWSLPLLPYPTQPPFFPHHAFLPQPFYWPNHFGQVLQQSLIPSFLKSPLMEEIEAQEGIPKPSSPALVSIPLSTTPSLPLSKLPPPTVPHNRPPPQNNLKQLPSPPSFQSKPSLQSRVIERNSVFFCIDSKVFSLVFVGGRIDFYAIHERRSKYHGFIRVGRLGLDWIFACLVELPLWNFSQQHFYKRMQENSKILEITSRSNLGSLFVEIFVYHNGAS